MIYLFTNRTYGAPFIRAAARHARRTGARITVVFSGHRKRERNRGGPARALRDIAARWLGAREPAAAGLPLIVVDDVNAPAFLATLEPRDCGIIAGFDQIFGAAAIARFRSFANVHPSLLPFYRGPEPAYWCLENHEAVTGFTIHTVTTKIDSGEIHYQQALAIEADDDAEAITDRIALLAIHAFERWLDHITTGAPWQKRFVDAAALYRVHVDYKSFRPAAARRPQAWM